jgi:hypothetical protein
LLRVYRAPTIAPGDQRALVCHRIAVRFALIVRDNGAGLNAKHFSQHSSGFTALMNWKVRE